MEERSVENVSDKNAADVFESLLDHTGVALLITDLDTDEILYTNKALRQMYRLHEQGQGGKCWRLVGGMDVPCALCPKPQLRENPQQVIVWEQHDDKAQTYCRKTDTTMPWIDGRLVHVQSNIDITHEVMTARQLEKATAQAAESDKTKADFLSRVSHELKTPVNHIIGLNHIALNACESEYVSKTLNMLDNSAKHLSNLIDGLLSMSSIESNNLSLDIGPFLLASIVTQCITPFIDLIKEKRLQLELGACGYLPAMLLGDAAHIGQIVGSLFDNAVKFTPNEGTVRLLLAGEEMGAGQLRLTIAVSDTGIGMSKEQQQVLFNLFEQVDGTATREYGGVGLGMALSNRLVKMMHGTLEVESRRNAGTVFTVMLPLDVADATIMLNCQAIVDDVAQHGIDVRRNEGGYDSLLDNIRNFSEPEPVETKGRKLSSVASDMNAQFFNVEMALKRVMDNENVLIALLRSFLHNPNQRQLAQATHDGNWKMAQSIAAMIQNTAVNLALDELFGVLEVLQAQLAMEYYTQETLDDLLAAFEHANTCVEQYINSKA